MIVVKKLTDRQKQILEFIMEENTRTGSAPSISGIGRYLNISAEPTVRRHIKRIEKKGYVEMIPHVGIRVLRSPDGKLIKLRWVRKHD